MQDEKLKEVTKDCEQLVAAFNDLKTVIDSLFKSSGKLQKLLEIRENRLSYDENKSAQ